ncbi:MAG: RHS repeat domain-containing protein [Candidatus Nanopelagicales bacterium]
MKRRGVPPGAAVIAAVAAGAVLLAGQPAQGAPRSGQSNGEDAVAVAAAVDTAGIETAGPIPTAPGSGSRETELPPTVATVPGGNALHGDYPYLRVKDLEDAGSVTVRVYDASLGKGEIAKEEDKDFTWQGSLDQGWGQIGKRLISGHGYVLWVRDVREDGSVRWLNFGRFGVRGLIDPPGPGVRAGGMSAALATGAVTWTWESESLAGPAAGVRVALQYAAASPSQDGVPNGWRLMAATGSPWMALEESGSDVRGHVTPAQPSVERTSKRTATVDFAYDTDDRADVDRYLIEQRVKGEWVRVGRAKESFADPDVDTRIRLVDPKAPVRVGLKSEGTVLYSPAAKPRAAAAEITSVPDEPAMTECGGSASTLTGPESVRLEGWNGMSLTFIRNPVSGVYEQAIGGDKVPGYRNILSLCGDADDRRWLFTDSSGLATEFKAGRAVRVKDQGRLVSTAAWSGDRLTTLTNAVGRSLTLSYGNCTTWPGFAATDQLCRVAYPGGVQTEIGYVADGLPEPQIALIKDPGNTGTALGYDSVGRLTATRGALANRAATTDAAARTALARVTYDAKGRAVTLTEAPSSAGADVVVQTLDVPVITESDLRSVSSVQARIAGSASGYQMSNTAEIDPVTHDGKGFSDQAELRTSTQVDGRRVTSRDARGLLTKTRYDASGNLVKQSGPAVSGATGMQVTQEYDTVTRGGRDETYEGFRATVFAGDGFTGTARPEHWTPGSGGGLSADWDASTQSAVAQAIWTPSEADDQRARKEGWTFAVDQAPGSQVQIVIEGNACDGPVCTFTDLPSGPKQVSVEVASGPPSGWFNVQVGIGSDKPERVAAELVRPGFNNRTSSVTNDTFVGSEARPTVDYTYAAPETGKVTSVELPGGFTSTLDYETAGWGRVTTYTTPGGKRQETEYWPDSGSATLPSVCTGSAAASGQPRKVTRQDGSTVETYFDVRGRQLAMVTTGPDGRSRETACQEYAADGRLTQSAVYDTDGRLIEQVREEIGIGGNPLALRQTVTHGPAAPVEPNTSVVTETLVDWAGRAVRYVDESGTTTVTTYTVLGESATIAVTPSAASSPLVTFAYDYRSTDGAPTRVSVNGVPMADVDYAPGQSSVQSVSYAGGEVTVGLTDGSTGRPSAVTVVAGESRYQQSQTFNEFGRIVGDETWARASGRLVLDEQRGYTYDVAGRLVEANVVADDAARARFAYDYSAQQDASCGGAYPGAGADTLRTGGARSGTAFITCYDNAGRLMSTTDPLLAAQDAKATFTYDGLGRVTAVDGRTDLQLTWGSGTALATLVDGSTTTTMSTYAGRTVRKSVTTGTITDQVRYSYVSAASSAPLLLLDDSGVRTVEFSLPGGARVRADAGQVPTLSLTGLDGAALAVIDLPDAAIAGHSGSGLSGRAGVSERFGPYGEPLDARPSVLDAAPCYLWQAADRRETLGGEAAITLMGARPYLPAAGIFLAPDPDLDAGTNLYSFTAGDPINGTDRMGAANEWSWFWMVITAVLVVATVVADVATLGMAAPATGAGLGAWATYIGLAWVAPIGLGMLAGKALEQSVLSQTEPSAGLDSFRSVLGWTQTIAGLGTLGVPIVKWAGRKVAAIRGWWTARQASTVGGANLGRDLADDLAGTALSSARRTVSLPQTARLSVDSLSNGGRQALSGNVGRLSLGFDLSDIESVRTASFRQSSTVKSSFAP